jgi:trans-2,3-dihydro-3-hydroxyanthranilate isomerase
MVLEIAMLSVRAGQEAAFEAAFDGAQTLLARQSGYLGHELLRCLEAPGRYALHVRWRTVADHEAGFRRSAAYPEWRARLHGFYDPFPTVEHFERVAPAPAGGRVLPYVTVDVFTDARFGGNPLAVFPDARGLTDAEMQQIAAETNYSETTFVLPPDDPAHTARVRIFNRVAEMPFAGHPNVGTAVVLAGLGHDVDGWLRFEEPAGLVAVRVERGADRAVTSAHVDAPEPLTLGRELAPADVAACIGLAPGDLVLDAHPPRFASVGLPFCFVEVRPEALERAQPDLGAFRTVAEDLPEAAERLPIHLYAWLDRDTGRLATRMFSPLSGTVEDPATGSANAALAAFLLHVRGGERAAFDIAQGVAMGRPSRLAASAWRTPDGVRARVGGGAVAVFEGVLRLPDAAPTAPPA